MQLQAHAVRTYDLWHGRLGHPSRQVLSLLTKDLNIGDIFSNKVDEPCDICFRAKQTRCSFSESDSKASELFELIHCDIWGAYHIPSTCGAHYFLTIVDDTSRAVWVYLMHNKNETSSFLQNFVIYAKNHFDKNVRFIRSDNGNEFTSNLMRQFYSEKGIVHQTSCVGTPQQNARVERKHRHILNVARALRFHAHMPIELWGECVLTAAYLINRTPTPLLKGKTPYECLFGSTPSYDNVRIFGCLCYAKAKNRTNDKFASRSRKCVFVGYPYGKKGWKLYDLETKEIFVSRDVEFCEEVFPFSKILEEDLVEKRSVAKGVVGLDVFEDPIDLEHKNAGVRGPEVNEEGCADCTQETTETGPSLSRSAQRESGRDSVSTDRGSILSTGPMQKTDLGLRRSDRARQAPTHLTDYICYGACSIDPSPTASTQQGSSGTPYPIVNFVTCNKFSPAHQHFLAAITKVVEPRYYQEAAKSPLWRKAMAEEIQALEENQTWTIEELPAGKKPISCKWVYRVKYKSDGSIERYKARLVIRGDHQVEGFDFHETFAPVAKMTSVRVFLSVAIVKGWDLHQLDVNNAFLHGDLEEEVYMRMPPGFYSSTPNRVCRLRKSLYGLRQAPRQWFAKLSSKLEAYGFVRSYADYSLFTYRKGNVFMGLLVYVDDIILAGNDTSACQLFKEYLNACFRIKDLGQLKYFLGIEVARGPKGLFLCQRKYALEIVEECGLLGGKPTASPLAENHKLALASGNFFDDPTQYRRLIGRLIYLTITRPDLSYAVHVLSQFMHAPRAEHFQAACRVLRYIKGSPGLGILLRADSALQVYAFCDSDWGACPLTRRSLTGFFVTLGGSPVSWKTKKQATVSRSSAEAEYRSMAVATSELVWLKTLLASLGVFPTQAMKLFCDSQAAIHIAKNPVFHERTKHIDIDCHFVRERLVRRDLVLSYLPSRQQPADLFTKALGIQQFLQLRSKLGMIDLHAPT